jgi:hypothetical protein
MNIFRLAGDMSHVFSIIILLLRLRVVKNAAGTYVFIVGYTLSFDKDGLHHHPFLHLNILLSSIRFS